VEELSTHGGSLRVFAQRSDSGRQPRSNQVNQLLQREADAGMLSMDCYASFQKHTDQVKNGFLAFLLDARSRGRTVAAYGAAAKGNTLMNYAGVRPDLISFVVDRNPAKQGKFMPGSRIPIVEESRLKESRPDFIVILPWNLKAELARQLEYTREWGAQFVTAVPALEVS